MLILALDTTTRAGSVALLRDDAVLVERVGDAARTHGERLPADLIDTCRAAALRIDDVDLFAVAAGPGSFTGLRIGIATIQGLAMARQRTVVPVSTLEALAVAAPSFQRVAAWMDAQRGEVFAQVFERTAAGATLVQPVTDPISSSPERALEAHAPWLGGAAFQGDGAIRYQNVIRARLGDAAPMPFAVPALAGAIGRIAASQPARAVLPHAVIPIYVRRPDAEIARDRRGTSS